MNLRSIANLGVAALAAQRLAKAHAAPTKAHPHANAKVAVRDAVDLRVSSDGTVIEEAAPPVPVTSPAPAAPPPPRKTLTTSASQFVTVTLTMPNAVAATSILSTPPSPPPSVVSSASAPPAPVAVGAPSAGPDDPTITLQNKSSQTRYYFIEASAGSDPENLNGKVVSVPPGGAVSVNPGVGFNGAITDNGTNSAAACLGTRIKFNASGDGVYYDADTQYGNTDATFGPTDGSGILEGNGDLQHYILAGAVEGKAESAADQYSDKSTQHVSTRKFTLTSLDYTPGVDGGDTYTAAQDPNKIYGVAYATGTGGAMADN